MEKREEIIRAAQSLVEADVKIVDAKHIETLLKTFSGETWILTVKKGSEKFQCQTNEAELGLHRNMP